MSHRDTLPQLSGDRLFITDGGLETTLIFHQGLDLPLFAAFDLLKTRRGQGRDPLLLRALRRDRQRERRRPDPRHRHLAREPGLGRAARLLAAASSTRPTGRRRAGEEIGEGVEGTVVLDGVVGPRGDGYVAENLMSAGRGAGYHSVQIGTFADTAADMVGAITMTYAEEAIGLTRAARDAGLPVAISFTVETDGRLPSGQALQRGRSSRSTPRPTALPPTS